MRFELSSHSCVAQIWSEVKVVAEAEHKYHECIGCGGSARHSRLLRLCWKDREEPGIPVASGNGIFWANRARARWRWWATVN